MSQTEAQEEASGLAMSTSLLYERIGLIFLTGSLSPLPFQIPEAQRETVGGGGAGG